MLVCLPLDLFHITAHDSDFWIAVLRRIHRFFWFVHRRMPLDKLAQLTECVEAYNWGNRFVCSLDMHLQNAHSSHVLFSLLTIVVSFLLDKKCDVPSNVDICLLSFVMMVFQLTGPTFIWQPFAIPQLLCLKHSCLSL